MVNIKTKVIMKGRKVDYYIDTNTAPVRKMKADDGSYLTVRVFNEGITKDGSLRSENYNKGLGISILNPAYPIYIAEIVRKALKYDIAEFAEKIGYPDRNYHQLWIETMNMYLDKIRNMYQNKKRVYNKDVIDKHIDNIKQYAKDDSITSPVFRYANVGDVLDYKCLEMDIINEFGEYVRIDTIEKFMYWKGKLTKVQNIEILMQGEDNALVVKDIFE